MKSKLYVVTSTEPIVGRSYTKVPYTKEAAEEREIRTGFLKSKYKKCYKPIDRRYNVAVPGGQIVGSFQKLSEEDLGFFIRSESGFQPDSYLARWLYAWLLKKDFDD